MPQPKTLSNELACLKNVPNGRVTNFPTALQRDGRSLSIAVGRASGNKAGTRIGALRETALENARFAAHIT